MAKDSLVLGCPHLPSDWHFSKARERDSSHSMVHLLKGAQEWDIVPYAVAKLWIWNRKYSCFLCKISCNFLRSRIPNQTRWSPASHNKKAPQMNIQWWTAFPLPCLNSECQAREDLCTGPTAFHELTTWLIILLVIVQQRTGTNGRLVQEQKVSTVDPKEKADSTKIKFQFKGVLEPG